MAFTLAFDVYGTLIDTNGLALSLAELVGDSAHEFSIAWREKQLEYTFRRGLMQRYEPFSTCTEQALNFTCAAFELSLTSDQKQQLLTLYRDLPAFEDVVDTMERLSNTAHSLYAFSNGSTDMVDQLLSHANIRHHFIDIVSVDEIKTYKPDPVVYQHFLARSNSSVEETWLISSNPFDVIGAMAIGMRAVWLKRSQRARFDPWLISPTITISNLAQLPMALAT